MLETLTPSEYLRFRDVLGAASGFQSAQYRKIEFMLGYKNATRLSAFDGAVRRHLEGVLQAPGLYDEFLRHLARQGYAIPAECIERDWSQAYEAHTGLLPVFKQIYEAPQEHWDPYAMCEKLVDIEEHFHLWRFRHIKTVERVIGYRRGTGGTAGVAYLKEAMDIRLFPELFDVRTQIGVEEA